MKPITINKEHLKSLRKNADYTLDHLADLLSWHYPKDKTPTSKGQISGWENGKHKKIAWHAAQAYCSVFKCTMDYISGKSDDPKLTAREWDMMREKRDGAVWKQRLARRRKRLIDYLAVSCSDCKIEVDSAFKYMISVPNEEYYTSDEIIPPTYVTFARDHEMDIICDTVDRAIENACRSYYALKRITLTNVSYAQELKKLEEDDVENREGGSKDGKRKKTR